jgi:hypothetical protein
MSYINELETGSASTLKDWAGSGRGIAWNFPKQATIRDLVVRFNEARSWNLEISNNSSNGYDGDWVSVHSSTISPSVGVISSYTLSNPTAGTWFRIYATSGDTGAWYSAHLYGEYVQPSFEFWDATPTAELTGVNPLAISTIGTNNSDFNEYSSFKIKNTNIDGLSHTYTVYALPVVTDTTVSNNIFIAHDSFTGGDKVAGATGWTTPSVANGAFSQELRVYSTISQANNPADGFHYFLVKVVEA